MTFHHLIALGIGAATVVLVGIACGGDGSPTINGDSPLNELVVTPTPRPTATATPTPSRSDNLLPKRSGTEELLIRERGFDVVDINLNAGDILRVSYDSVGAIMGGSQTPIGEVELVILDPIEERILSVAAIKANSVELQAQLTGRHRLVFSNPFLLQSQTVRVEWVVG